MTLPSQTQSRKAKLTVENLNDWAGKFSIKKFRSSDKRKPTEPKTALMTTPLISQVHIHYLSSVILHMLQQRSGSGSVISAFIFPIGIVQFLYFLHPEFPASSNLLCLHSPVCLRPGRKRSCWLQAVQSQKMARGLKFRI